jgi:hypothetical protein
MPNPIDSENVIAWLNAQIEKVQGGWLHDYGFPTNVIAALTDVKRFVKNLPTIEPEEPTIEPGVRLIDANALKAKLKIDTNTATYSDYCNGYCDARQVDLDTIDSAPTIELEVRHGRWETIDPSFSSVYCSECGAAADKYLAKRYKGCPFCLCVMSATDTNAGGKGGNG